MRVGIDTLFEDPAVGTGGVTYIHNLVHRLAEIDENEYVLYVSPQNRGLFDIDRPNVRHVLCPWSKERRLSTIAYEQTVLPFLARRDRLDVFHAPGNIAPAWLPCASVLTVHTLHHWLHPEMLPLDRRVFRRALMPRSARRAEAVIAVSDYVKHELERIVGLPSDKVVTVYLGAPEDAPATSEDLAVDVPDGSILFVSALWPYKNAEVVIRALARLRERHVDGRPVVIAGTGSVQYESDLRELARRSGVADAVHFVGHVPQARIGAVYARAAVVVYPSLEEYFGLPALEAMAAGVPLIASDRSSIPEVVGDAGVLVPATDADAVADAIARVLGDEAFREDLVARGRERVRRFTWERAARATADVYRTAYDRRAAR
jgi:glycosyltransferase involved in cell wall biosynthesis